MSISGTRFGTPTGFEARAASGTATGSRLVMRLTFDAARER